MGQAASWWSGLIHGAIALLELKKYSSFLI